MQHFYDKGRERELSSLEELHERGEFVFAVIYGRRRVGKTSLIREFVKRKEKKSICFMATENSDSINREAFSQSVFSVYPQMAALGCFPTWESAFAYIASQSENDRIVVSIDEYPYLAKSNPAISSELQRCIDNILQGTNVFLILCGSSMSFIENQVLGYQSPLYGRRTAQYKIMPLDYYDSAEFFSGASMQDKLLGYGVTGGIPQYLQTIAKKKNMEAAIADAFFTKSGFLYEEPQNLLKQELREPALYNTIVTVIAEGATRLGEIATKVGEADSKIAKYIKNLIDLGIIAKETPALSEGSRNGIYYIADNMYRFWHRFVPRALTLVENGYSNVYDMRVKPHVPGYMGFVFETVCRQYLLRRNVRDELPFLFDVIGRWWGGNPVTKKETEIDIVAASKERIILGECKWKNERMDIGAYKGLREKAVLFSGREACFYLFSKSGFSTALIEEAARDESLRLVSLEELFAGE